MAAFPKSARKQSPGISTASRTQTFSKIARARELTADEAYAAFEALAREYLDLSGAEFLRKWRQGEFAACTDDSSVRRVAMMIPGADRRS